MTSAAPSPLQYLFDAPPAASEVREVAPGVHWIRMPLPFALDHINLWLLEDDDGFVLVDCGLGNQITRDIWEQILTQFVRGRPIKKVVVTHLHPDHAGNAGWFTARYGVQLYMSQADYLMAHAWRDNTAGYTDEASLGLFRDHGLSEEKLDELRNARSGNFRQMVPEFPMRYHRLMAGDTMTIGGRVWRMLVGFGHAPEHILLYCDRLNLLISGDMVLPRISTNISVHATQPDSDPLKLFLDSLKSYLSLPTDTLVLPSHGLVFRGLHERVKQLVDHHELRLSELEEACVTPKATADVIGTLFRRKLDGHQIWFAMGEALAHLNLLVDEGRVKRIVHSGGGVQFVRT